MFYKCCSGFVVPHTIVHHHVGASLSDIDGSRKTWFRDDEAAASADDSPVEWVDAEHPLFLLYTRHALI